MKGAGGCMWWSGCVGNDKSGFDAVGGLAEALLWSFSYLLLLCDDRAITIVTEQGL